MAINPKAASELNIFTDDVGDATSPPDFMNSFIYHIASTSCCCFFCCRFTNLKYTFMTLIRPAETCSHPERPKTGLQRYAETLKEQAETWRDVGKAYKELLNLSTENLV